jgi:uncharacterized protein (DUF1330 family)
MRYYIETGSSRNKAEYLISNHGAQRISEGRANELIGDDKKAVICVIDNGSFEAAAYIYNENEFIDFSDSRDMRLRKWLVMDKALAERLSGYEHRH